MSTHGRFARLARFARFAVRLASPVLCAIVALPGCSSGSSKDPDEGEGDAAAGAGGDSAEAGGSSSEGGKSGKGGGSGEGGKASGNGGKASGSGGTSGGGGAVNASEECVTFCTCMDENCAEETFPNGCLADCAAQTAWDLPCRQNMCNNDPFQPENGHCVHAMGRGECLDTN